MGRILAEEYTLIYMKIRTEKTSEKFCFFNQQKYSTYDLLHNGAYGTCPIFFMDPRTGHFICTLVREQTYSTRFPYDTTCSGILEKIGQVPYTPYIIFKFLCYLCKFLYVQIPLPKMLPRATCSKGYSRIISTPPESS